MRARIPVVLLVAALVSLPFDAGAQTRPSCPGGRLAGGASPGALAACRAQGDPIEALLFSRTTGFRHASIADAWRTLGALPAAENIRVTLTEDPAVFTDDVLAGFDVVLFVNTTGDVLDEAQQGAMERFLRSGKGYVGVHSAADTEYGWPWYGRLVGAYFRSHPLLPVEVEVTTEDGSHPSTEYLADTFLFTDEIYNFDRNPRRDNVVLLTVDEEGFIYPNTDGGPSMGDDHPIAWYKEFEGGRSFYTNLGHRSETWDDPLFRRHLLQGIRWAAGVNRWNRIVLTDRPRNPLSMDVADDGRVFWVERAGEVRIWDPTTGRSDAALQLAVSRTGENGLLGVVLAPDFARTGALYLYYAAPDPPGLETGVLDQVGENRLSRFRMSDRVTVDPASEEVLLRVPSARGNHEAGDLEFGPDGMLFLSIGDNTNPFGEADGFAPLDAREDRTLYDARRTAQNPFDLRGAILRLTADGAPAPGNLFPADGSQGRPEIYIKGTRNPFRIAIDPSSGRLFWGDVGPDAFFEGPRGPRGYDEINLADRPGNHGWPLCIGFNRPYSRYDYATKEVGEPYSCEGFVPPLVAYDYTTVDYLAIGRAFLPDDDHLSGRTAIAGEFYRLPPGNQPFALPAPHRDSLLMTEWARDLLVSIQVSETGELEGLRRMVPWERFIRPIDLGVGPDGALYVLEYGSAFGGDNPDARLSRIEYNAAGDLTPVARITPSLESSAETPVTVSFSAEGSFARNDAITAYEWDLDGDHRVDATGPEAEHTFTTEGTYSVTLTVRSREGRKSFPTVTRIFVGNSAPEVTIVSPPEGAVLVEGQETTLEGSAVDAQEGDVACGKLVWDVRLIHNSHAHPVIELSGCNPTFEPSLLDHNAGSNSFLAVELRATDRGGPGDENALTGSALRLYEVEPAG